MRLRLTMPMLMLMPSLAAAQVVTDPHGLDALPPSQAAKPPTAASPTTRKTARPRTTSAAHPRAGHANRLQAVAMPTVAPANPVIAPPPFVMPAHPPPPKPPVPVRADAAGIASPIAGGLRVTFGAASADLNPLTLAAIRDVAVQAETNPAMVISITAWAPGSPDDPSTPRRLSLDRALAIRAVLINAGIVSDRIRAIAKGITDMGGGPADRAEIMETTPTKP